MKKYSLNIESASDAREAGKQLEDICLKSVKTVREINPPRSKKNLSQNYRAALILLKSQ